jgi:hypothetical protein
MARRLRILAAAALLLGLTACTQTTSGSGTFALAGPSSPAAAAVPPKAAGAPVPSPSAAVLAARLKATGLHITQLIVYNVATDPNHLLDGPGGYTSIVAWADPAAIKAGAGSPGSGPEFGGGIEVFPDAADAQARYEELQDLKPFGDGYDYLAGTAILRLSKFLTPAQASRYEAVFRSIAG